MDFFMDNFDLYIWWWVATVLAWVVFTIVITFCYSHLLLKWFFRNRRITLGGSEH